MSEVINTNKNLFRYECEAGSDYVKCGDVLIDYKILQHLIMMYVCDNSTIFLTTSRHQNETSKTNIIARVFDKIELHIDSKERYIELSANLFPYGSEKSHEEYNIDRIVGNVTPIFDYKEYGNQSYPYKIKCFHVENYYDDDSSK